MLEKIFKLKENKTNVTTEILAGITVFFSVAYAIFITPQVLSTTGMSYNAVYVATILASAFGTFCLGLFANVPYVQCAGLGLSSLIAYNICGTMGFTWQEALAMVFICGVINVLITVTSIRKSIIKAIPEFMQNAITVGIGLFISYIGLKNAGIIEFVASSNGSITPSLTSFSSPDVILAVVGLIITIILCVRKVKGAYLIGIIATTLLGIPFGITKAPNFESFSGFSELSSTFLKFDFQGLFSAKAGIMLILMTIFTLVISDLFDTIGTFIGTGKKAGIFQIDNEGNMSPKLERALVFDSLSSVVASILGTSNVTTYVESSVGIEAGGRTGLVAVTTSICFLLSIFFAPLVACIPTAAIAPVLILIGVSMIQCITDIDFKDLAIGITAFFIIIMMPLSYSITTGIEWGFIAYSIVALASGKGKSVSPIVYIFSILFVVSYVFGAIS